MFKLVSLLIPILVSCGGSDIGGGGGGGGGGTEVDIPDDQLPSSCKEGQLLGTNAQGKLVCVDRPSSSLTNVAGCADGEVLNSDGTSLTCVKTTSGSLDTEVQNTIDQITKTVDDKTTTATIIRNGGGARSKYKGNTDATTKGAITSGQATGIIAAAELCKAKFGAGAHMCTPYEITDSVAQGVITAATTVPQAWVYMANWKTPVASPTNPLDGISENCAGYTYGTGDQKWVGTTVKWEVVAFTNRLAAKFVSGSGSACNQSFPIACCQ